MYKYNTKLVINSIQVTDCESSAARTNNKLSHTLRISDSIKMHRFNDETSLMYSNWRQQDKYCFSANQEKSNQKRNTKYLHRIYTNISCEWLLVHWRRTYASTAVIMIHINAQLKWDFCVFNCARNLCRVCHYELSYDFSINNKEFFSLIFYDWLG